MLTKWNQPNLVKEVPNENPEDSPTNQQAGKTRGKRNHKPVKRSCVIYPFSTHCLTPLISGWSNNLPPPHGHIWPPKARPQPTLPPQASETFRTPCHHHVNTNCFQIDMQRVMLLPAAGSCPALYLHLPAKGQTWCYLHCLYESCIWDCPYILFTHRYAKQVQGDVIQGNKGPFTRFPYPLFPFKMSHDCFVVLILTLPPYFLGRAGVGNLLSQVTIHRTVQFMSWVCVSQTDTFPHPNFKLLVKDGGGREYVFAPSRKQATNLTRHIKTLRHAWNGSLDCGHSIYCCRTIDWHVWLLLKLI